MLKLYYSPGACSLFSHIVLEEAGADYEAQAISFVDGGNHAAWFLAINPKARVPALVVDGGGPWAFGDAYSLADPYLFVYANYLGMGDRGDPGRFPGIAAHRQRMLARSAVRRVFVEEDLSESVTEWFG